MDKVLLETLLKEGKSHRQIGEIVGLNHRTIWYWANKFGFRELNKFHPKEPLPTNFLSPIDTKEKAYLVGFILGDGHYTENEEVQISQSTKNKSVIEFLAKIVNGNVTYKTKLNKKTRTFPSANVMRKIPKIKMVLGGRLKPERHFPRIRHDLMVYLVRGLFDSDGSFTCGYRKDRNRFWCAIRFTHHLKCLTGLQKFLINELRICSAVRKKSQENCYVLDFSVRQDVNTFLHWLYSDTDFIPLKFKYEKYEAVRLKLEEIGETPAKRRKDRAIPSRAIECKGQ